MKDQIETILKTCIETLELDITSKTKTEDLVIGRAIYYTIARNLVDKCTLKELGQSVNKNHATVIHSLKMLDDLLRDKRVLSLYQKCVYNCCNQLGVETFLREQNRNYLHDEITRLTEKCNTMESMINRITKKALIKEISELTPEQYAVFEERSKLILKSIKSYRTYENTPRSAFNVN
jgi:hypothetical protein